MPEIGGKIAGSGYNLFDWVGVGISKRVTEIALTQVIGNGSLKSGALKIGGAYALDMVRPKGGMTGKISEYVAAGLVVDGVEDLTLALLGANPLSAIGIGSQSQDAAIVYV